MLFRSVPASNYSFKNQSIDKSPFSPISYYRISLNNNGNTTAYSSVVAVKAKESFHAEIQSGTLIFGELKIGINSPNPSTFLVSVYGADGRKFYQTKKFILGNGQSISIPALSFAKGMLTTEIIDLSSGERKTFRCIKG